MSVKKFKSETHVKAKRFPQYLAAFAVCLGSLCTGTVIGWTANTSEDLENGRFNNIEVDSSSLGWIGSIANVGAMFSCIILGPLCDWLGRKWGMLTLVIPYSLGWLLMIFAQNVATMMAGRFICGLGAGAFLLSAPMYVAETSDKKIRGALGALSEMFLTFGVVISYILGYLLSAKDATIVLAVFPIIFGLIFLTQPETPFYMLMRGKDEEALKIMQRLRGPAYDSAKELEQMKADLDEVNASKVPFLKAFEKRETKIATFLSLSAMFFQQACGLNAVLFYTSEIFNAAGVDEGLLGAEMSTIVVGAIQIFANGFSVLMIERLGRRILLVISGIFMALPEIGLAIYFTLYQRTDVSTASLQLLPVITLCIFVIAAEIGYGPIAWIIPVEVAPIEVKSTLTFVSGVFNWFISFLVTKFYLDLANSVGSDTTFYTFAVISLLGAIFPIVFLPETKGKSLLEIQKILRGKN